MSRTIRYTLIMILTLTTIAKAENSLAVRQRFEKPTRDYSSGPLWVWNDELTEQQIIDTIKDQADQHVKQIFVHPRPGLITPYLSERWMDLWKLALREGEKHDMNVWIYDENSYPSGFAGGWVYDAMPESIGQCIHIHPLKQPGPRTKNIIAVYKTEGDSFTNVTDAFGQEAEIPVEAHLVAEILWAQKKAWNGDRPYVNLLTPGVTEKFLEVTMEPYRKAVGHEFGKRIPGVFTDEPEIQPAGGFPWAKDLPEQFEKRWGYSLIDNLPCISHRIGDFKRVRHNYFQTLNDLFVERWAKPYYEYCEKYNLEFTGHYWEHDWPHCVRVPDNMAMYAWHQRPAIDTLFNRYSEDMHAQFGNVRAVKELASVANQMGRKRTLCEAYGAAGWELRFEDMKRIGDWLYVLGVNTLNEHLAFITIHGARKRDHPQSFSYHEPWWNEYHNVADYFTRLSVAMSAGKEINEILVLEPTTTAWMYNTLDGRDPDMLKVGASFQKFVTDLAKAQVEFDIGSEDILARHGSTKTNWSHAPLRGLLVVGKRSYSTVVIPPLTENLNENTLALLKHFSEMGGTLLFWDELPKYVDGRPSEAINDLAPPPAGALTSRIPNLRLLNGQAPIDMLKEDSPVVVDSPEQAIVYHQSRTLKDGKLIFVVNTSLEHSAKGRIVSQARGAEEWDLVRGGYKAISWTVTDNNKIEVAFELPPAGSALYFLSKKSRPMIPPTEPAAAVDVKPAGDMTIRRLEPNVLTLDFVDAKADDQTCENMWAPNAGIMVYKAHGLEHNPWDRAVQFREERISKTFAPDSGFEATYRFTIEDKVPDQLAIAIEQGDKYEITCNGQPVTAKADQWWCDKHFIKADIANAAKVGENTVTIKAQPFDIRYELEAAYVVGNFTLKSTGKGFTIQPDAPMKLGPWNKQNHPLYGHRVEYKQTFEIDKPAGRYTVSLPKWYGSVATVTVNGQDAGTIWHQPWECDITRAIKPGKNQIAVTVVGTLRNTFGPHHGKIPLGLTGPGSFHGAPKQGPPAGHTYLTIDYGLFEPFELRRETN